MITASLCGMAPRDASALLLSARADRVASSLAMLCGLGAGGGFIWFPGALHPARLAILAVVGTGAAALHWPRARSSPAAVVALAAAATATIVVTLALFGGGACAEGAVQLLLPVSAVILHMAVSPAFSLCAAALAAAALLAAPSIHALLPAALRASAAPEPLGFATASFAFLALALALASAWRTDRALRGAAAASAAAALEAARASAVLNACLPRRVAAAVRTLPSRDWRGAADSAATLAVVFVRLPALAAARRWAAPPGARHPAALDELAAAWELATQLAAARGVSVVEVVGCELVGSAPAGAAGEGARACAAFARDFAVALRGRAAPPVCAGVAFGVVTSGIVGATLPQFCLVGSAVNLAARMATLAEQRAGPRALAAQAGPGAGADPEGESESDGGSFDDEGGSIRRGCVVVAVDAVRAGKDEDAGAGASNGAGVRAVGARNDLAGLADLLAAESGAERGDAEVKGFSSPVHFVAVPAWHGAASATPLPLQPSSVADADADADVALPAADQGERKAAPLFDLGSPEVDDATTRATAVCGILLVCARAAAVGERAGPAAAVAFVVAAFVLRQRGERTLALALLALACAALPACAPSAAAAAFDTTLVSLNMSTLHGAGVVPSAVAFAAFAITAARFAISETTRPLVMLSFFAFDIVRVARAELGALHARIDALRARAAAEHASTAALVARMLPLAVADAVTRRPALLDGARGVASLGACAEVRADVAIVSADLVGYTQMVGGLSAGDAMLLLNFAVARLEAVARDGGATKVRTVGDCFLASVGLGEGGAAEGPGLSARARAVSRAVCVALAYHSAFGGGTERGALKHVADAHAAAEPPLPARLADAGARLRLRVGVHVGDVTYGVICIAGARTDVFGPAAMAAKAAESSAPAGGTLLSPAAARAFAEAQLAPALALRVRVEPAGGGGALVAAMAPRARGSDGAGGSSALLSHGVENPLS